MVNLTPKLQQIVEEELNENPERTKNALSYIKIWLQKQPHLHVRTDDEWLLLFLRSSKFSLECTKKKLEKFYTAKTLSPEFYLKRDPFDPNIQDILTKGANLPLENPINEDEPIVFLQMQANFDLNKYNTLDIIKATIMVADTYLMNNNRCNINGMICLIDLEKASLGLLAVPISLIKKQIKILNNYPARIKSIRVFNVSPMFETIVKKIHFLLNEKIGGRVSIYSKGNNDKVFEGISKDIIPEKYGGYGGTIEEIAVKVKNMVEKNELWFKEDENYCTFENLRYGKALSESDVFGVEGSIRKLEID